ncbi:MAG: amidohydrolase family protein [Chloroflexi bacterium]|nr:amidohydrolase family protein [Chloroflexota bacterium]MCH8113853.1 amidohydrolase family protein [Chloroflexota bacterium]MCI0775657.1 amidohydrolase family protein [Chloroflexota bacterium]MCI0834863.1 amidohydrolase family protein [Chloroflexota bacterium]MCI0851761.1 amidohydrolase family protein [Chloroflexota bacterium]
MVTPQQFDLVLKNGRVVDPANNIDGQLDLGIKHGKIAMVAENIAPDFADDIIDVTDQVVMPGHIDTHAHLSSPFHRNVDRAYGHAMLVESGTTTALDLAGDPTAMAEGMLRRGAGLNVASLMGLVPHSTITEDDPKSSVLRDVIADVKKRGGIGVKMLGGYHPFTPEVSANVVKEANDQLAWVAFHVGTKDSGSDMTGLREVPGITGNGRLHVAHINSYTRGMVDEPHEEVREALGMIERMRLQWVTEAYLAQANGTNGLCDEAGNLVYNVAQNCLKARGYPTTDEGIRAALLDGYGSALVERGGRVVLVTGQEAVDVWEAASTDASLSFPVNPPTSAFTLATAKYDDGTFRVDAISTDGGSLPRNVAIERTMALVAFGALSMGEAVIKLSYTPSRMLGLLNKGHFAEGADGDITVVNPATGRASMSLVAGELIMFKGRAVGRGGTWLVLEEGRAAAESSGLPFEVMNLENSRLYENWK